MGRNFSTTCPTEMTLVPFESAHRAGLNEPKITSMGCLVDERHVIPCPREWPISAWMRNCDLLILR